jgi:hypothetical protein
MASPYDSAIEMFGLPRFGGGPAPFPRREDPMAAARRRFLEGSSAPASTEEFVAERAQATDDPFGVMQEVENLRREREEEGFLSDIAALNPAQPNYGQSMMEMIQRNPRIAGSKSAMGLLDFQQNFIPKPQVDKFAVEAAGFGAPVYQAYQKALAAGGDPVSSYAQAMTEKARLEAMTKVPKPGEDDRLNLTGTPLEEFNAIMSGIAATPEPTDAEKMAFLPAGKSQYTKEEWDNAYFQAKAKLREDAIGKLQNFQNVYGLTHQVPGVPRRTAMAGPQTAAAAPMTPDPWAGRTSVGPQAQAIPTPAPATQVSEDVVSTAPQRQVSPTAVPPQAPMVIPTISGGAQTPVERVASGVGQAFSNLRQNIGFSPANALAASSTPGGIASMMTTPPPTPEEQNKAWTDAKSKVRDFLSKMPGSQEEKIKYLGSVFTEETVPEDFFTKKKRGGGNPVFISAATAFEDAMREADPNLPKGALRDKDGSRTWKDVARMVALEELEKQGYVRRAEKQSPRKTPNIKAIREKK